MSFSQSVQLTVQYLLTGISVGLWTLAIRERLRNIPLLPFNLNRPRPLPVGILFALFLLCMVVFPPLWQQLWHVPSDAPFTRMKIDCLYRLLICPVLSLLLFRVPVATESSETSPPSRKSWISSLGVGTWGYFFSLLPVYLLYVIVQDYRHQDHRLIELLKTHSGPEVWIWVFLTAVVAAPLFEEMMFRVLLQGAFVQIWRPLTAIIASSLLFCTCHVTPDGNVSIDAVPLFPLAIILGHLYQRTGSYLAIIWTHALFNGFNLLLYSMR